MARRRCFFGTRSEIKSAGGEYGSAVTLSCSSAASDYQVTLRTNRAWHVRSAVVVPGRELNPSWATLNATTGTAGEENITVSVQRNNTEEAKHGLIVFAPRNDRAWSYLYLDQENGQIPTYTITFHKGIGQTDTIHRVDYSVAGTDGYITNLSNQQTIPGTYVQGTVITYTARTTGYYDCIGTATVQGHNLDIYINQEKVVVDRYFEVTAVEARPNIYGYYENSMMPNGAALLHSDCRVLTVVYRTNIVGVVPRFTYLSGSTNWISGITENVALTPPTGENQTFTLTYNDNLDTSIFNKAKISFESSDGAVYGELQIMTTVDEKSENDYIYISSSSTFPSERNLDFTAGAAGRNITVWCRTNTTTELIFDRSSGLRFYNGQTGEEIVGLPTPGSEYTGPYIIFPTQIMGHEVNVGPERFMPLIISVPPNTSYNDTKSYSIRLESEYYDNFDLSWHDYANITINQSSNALYRGDYYINDFWLMYGTQGYQESAITIPSSAITYYASYPGTESAIITNMDLRCREYDAAGTVDNDVAYTAITTSSGSGIIVDTSKLQIDIPNWLYEANGIGGTSYDYTPVAGSPWRLNARANQGYNTGASRNGDVTVRWVGGSAKPGGDTAKTVNVIQEYGQLVRDRAIYIYSMNNVRLPEGTIQTAATLTSPSAAVSFELSAVSGTQIIFDTYMGDYDLNNNLSLTINGQTLTTSSAFYTIPNDGLSTLIVRDKNNSSNYSVTLKAITAPPSSQYDGPTLLFGITRTNS